MTLNDELQTGKQVEKSQKSTRTDLTCAYAHQQVADAKEAITFGAPRVQDRLAKCGLLYSRSNERTCPTTNYGLIS